MLTEFMLKHPDLVDPRTRTSLYIRPAGILVRPGNPKKIKSLKDLTKDGVRIVDVNGAGQLGLWRTWPGSGPHSWHTEEHPVVGGHQRRGH